MERKKTKEKIVNVILNIFIFIFSIIFFISLYTGFQIKVLKNKYSNFFGYSVFEVQTNSMKDKINAGDWIIVKITKDVGLSDIVTYRLNNDFITHRVVSVYKGTYITQGDANTGKDDPVDESQIVGKVVKVIPSFGLIKKTLFNPFVLITLILTLLVISLTFKPRKKKKVEIDKPVIDYEIYKEEYSEEKEEELAKTSMYRVVAVDDEDVDEKYKVIAETNETEEMDDLEKTAIYRMITVDSEEIDNTLLEIAEHEMAQPEPKVEVKEEKVVVEEVVEEEGFTNIDLDLKNKIGKDKNIIEVTMILKESEINEVVDLFVESNKNVIKNKFIKEFINARYYNYYDGNTLTVKNVVKKVDEVLKSVSDKLLVQYKDDKALILFYLKVLRLFNNLDYSKTLIVDEKIRREFYRKEIDNLSDFSNVEFYINRIFNIQKKYIDILNSVFDKMESSTFVLELNELSKKEFYGANLVHNINFSKVYSEYIIDKTYTEGVIGEDKLIVLISLLLRKLIKNMIASDFSKKYVLYFPSSLFSKEKKFARFLKMFENEFAKLNIIILVSFSDLLKHRNLIKKFLKFGYKFGVYFNNNDVVNKEHNIVIMDYLFVSKEDLIYSKLDILVSEEYKNNVIIDDIISKVGGE